MKFEVGKVYKTRDGRKAKVIYIEPELSNAYTMGAILEGVDEVRSYHSNGHYFMSGGTGSDLVSEWEEPKPHITAKDVGRVVELRDGTTTLITGYYPDKDDYKIATYKFTHCTDGNQTVAGDSPGDIIKFVDEKRGK